jgi:hypothetical protein
LHNRFKPHLSLINTIEINEDSDPEIEDFLAEEDPDCHKSDPNQPYDYVNNLPPCLKDSKGFTGIKLGQGPTTGSVDVLTPNYMLHRQITPSVHCEVCLHWIERYYNDIPILQARIKSLTNHNELLIKENRELKENEQRQTKRLKKTGNIVIKNADSVKAVINSEIS